MIVDRAIVKGLVETVTDGLVNFGVKTRGILRLLTAWRRVTLGQILPYLSLKTLSL